MTDVPLYDRTYANSVSRHDSRFGSRHTERISVRTAG